ncbi:hypothetical protein COV23_02200 [Candidatus Wolfebacteria bacterium CG10_big_fil_rev_8_21_14_0_10_31_9]|uniref:Uncharacterized protein n=1 Tax=Candidatus Wolfebacteria bacterium CG10_big_fil_rev_8_21_14_0_10_31_9 TaxID=1975070 RepID=A0A2H0RC97_9BACT|nr:MAG: hypothetical protein COV23_02200 [Candidatus Wolfebacteria bacterium CG10_big_fil_rev_8_21_14_0_10_31_9]
MKESLEPIKEKQALEIDANKITQQAADNLREKFKEMKDINSDPHMKYIEPSKLTYDDLMIFGKALNHELSSKEFEEYSNRIYGIFGEEFISNQRNQMETLRGKKAKSEISDDEFEKQFREILSDYDNKRAGKGENQYEAEGKLNSRATFKAMVRHWLIDRGE